MKVGLYLRDVKPTEGGASQFSKTVADRISHIRKKYDVVVCYRGNPFSRTVIEKKGVTYLNINSYLLKNYIRLLGRQAKLDMNDIKRKYTLRPRLRSTVSILDDMARKYGIDIYWFVNPDHEILSTPFIYTVWDLGHRILPMFPEVSSPVEEWNKRELRYVDMLPRASYIITGNITGKKEIIGNYSVMEEKIRVIPFEISTFCYGEEKKPGMELPEDFFIYPAQFWPHKNHVCIIEVLKILKDKQNCKVNVLFTGADKGNKAYIQDVAKKYGVDDQITFLGYVSDEELKYLYTHAKALIFASVMGPNNLPPIEAIFLGCPAIVSGIDGHKEQMRDAALFYEKGNSDSLAKVILNVLRDENRIRDLKTKMEEYKKEVEEYSYGSSIMDILDEFYRTRKSWRNG